MIVKTTMILTDDDFVSDVTVVYKGKGANSYNQTVQYWRILYRYADWSIYFDIDDTLGVVGRPYFELWDGNDTERFYADKSGLSDAVKELCKQHDKELIEFPERFL